MAEGPHQLRRWDKAGGIVQAGAGACALSRIGDWAIQRPHRPRLVKRRVRNPLLPLRYDNSRRWISGNDIAPWPTAANCPLGAVRYNAGTACTCNLAA